MSYLTRWEPFREMVLIRNMMDRLVGDAIERPFEAFPTGYEAPSIDMYETDEELVVKASLPGIGSDDISISITGDALTISGEVKEEQKIDEADYHVRECRVGKFTRSVTLPCAVNADKAGATFQNGILTLRLPKAEGVKPKIIKVKSE